MKSRSTLTRQIDELKDRIVGKIKEELLEVENLSLTSDAWSSDGSKHELISVTGLLFV